jgi:uncharacterized membrane protein
MVMTCYRWTAMLKCAVTFVAIVGFTVPGGAADIQFLDPGRVSSNGSLVVGSSATGVNADGSVVVGCLDFWLHTNSWPIDFLSFSHAFRWTLQDNIVHDLGTLGGNSSSANGVNVDGSVVVGGRC